MGVGLALLAVVAMLFPFGLGEDEPNPASTAANLVLASGPFESPSVASTPTDIATPSPVPATLTLPLPSSPSTLAPSSTPVTIVTPSPIPYLAVSAERLNVYVAPGDNYKVLGEVRRGDQLLVLGRLADGTWWQVDYFGLRGWIPAQPAGINVEPGDLLVVTPPALQTITPTAWIEKTTLGRSVTNREIPMTVIGNGTEMAVVIVGALDGTQTSTRDLVSAMTNYFDSRPQKVPGHVTVYLVPSINPDGVAAGDRYNANDVDINRNWETADWTQDPGEPGYPEGKPDAGGSRPFSEPETRALRDLLQRLKQQEGDVLVVALHASVTLSQSSGKVFPGATSNGFHDDSTDVAQRFAAGMQYSIETEWSDYTTSGELVTWCAEQDLTSIDVVFSDKDAVSSLQADFVRVLLEVIR
jgi:predicted deacylase